MNVSAGPALFVSLPLYQSLWLFLYVLSYKTYVQLDLGWLFTLMLYDLVIILICSWEEVSVTSTYSGTH